MLLISVRDAWLLLWIYFLKPDAAGLYLSKIIQTTQMWNKIYGNQKIPKLLIYLGKLTLVLCSKLLFDSISPSPLKFTSAAAWLHS